MYIFFCPIIIYYRTDQYHILPDNEESINHLLSSDTDNIKEAVKKESVSVVDQETSTVFTSSSIATIPKEKLSAKERLLVSKALKQSKYNEPKDTASSTMANIGGYHPPPTPIRESKKKRIGTLSDLDRLPGKQLASQTGGRSKASRSRNDKSTGGRSTEVRNVSPLSSSRSVSSSGQLRFQRSQSNTNEDNPPVKSTFASRRRRSVDSLQKLSITLKEKNYK